MCKICTKFWRIWFPFGIYIGFLEYSCGVYIWCDLDVHALLLRSLSPSQVLAFHRGLSFLHSTLRLDVWLLQHNLLFGCAFLESFTTNCQVSKRQTQEPCEASRKTCPNRILIFSAYFFSHEFSFCVFFSPLQLPHETPWDQSRLLLPWPWNIKPRPDRERLFFPSINHLLQCIFKDFYSFPQVVKNPTVPQFEFF